MLERVASCDGTVPISWLLLRANVCRFAKSPNHVGMEPDKRFQPRFKVVSVLERAASSDGTVPVSRLLLRANVCRLVRTPNAAGIGPVRSWSLSANIRSWSSLLRTGGMLPVSLFRAPPSCVFSPTKLTVTTRVLSTPIPTQEVMIEVVVSQFREALPCRVSLAAMSALQSATRRAGSGSAIAGVLLHTSGG